MPIVFFRVHSLLYSFFFFFNDTATTEIYTLSLRDALPISPGCKLSARRTVHTSPSAAPTSETRDRKSTRLNSSHTDISYAVFCLTKKHPLQQRRAARQYCRLPLVLACGGAAA